ncbi:MAG TPA: AlpA family phage regulatory protein [Gemmataceae bacterium]|jgi:predicted DNA-binding transcriptional regulator AlpA|nr:AlpA family phage regulatory protein [Gemmataceae bacterium]
MIAACLPVSSVAAKFVDMAGVAKFLGVSKRTAERLHATERLPTPIRLSQRKVLWDLDDLRAWAGRPKLDGSLLDRAAWDATKAVESRRR